MAIKIKPADKAVADCLKAAHDYTCERCSKQGRMETSHVFSRSHRTIRWSKDNLNCLCFYCHKIWHSSPLEAHVWFIDKYGQGRMDLLLEKKNHKFKVPKIEEKEIKQHYVDQLKIIEEKRANGQTGYIDFVSWN